MKTKRNLIQICLLCAMLLALPTMVQAQWRFMTNNGAITITGYTGTNRIVIVPSATNGLPVTRIDGNGSSVFYLTPAASVTIPDSVTNIGNSVFSQSQSLTNIIIGNGVTSIGSRMGLETCPNLMAITVDANNLAFSSSDGVFFNKSQTTLIQFPADKVGNYAIPDSVVNIDDYSFDGCSSLTNVTIGTNVTSIGDYAFFGCSSLRSVAIPNVVTIIGYWVFYGCYSLTNVTIPNSVTNINNFAFGDCSGLANITIPNSVIGINIQAFVGCSNLTSVTIPSSVTYIGNSAFESCSSMTNITVDTANPNYASVGGVLFDKPLTTLLEYPAGLATSYAIPNSVTRIGNYAFWYCPVLTNVTIPSSVTSIGIEAFAYCSGLRNVTIPSSVTNISAYAFEYCTSLYSAYFQGNAPRVDGLAGNADNRVFFGTSGKVYYVPGTSGWGATFGGWATAGWYQPQPQILGSGYGLGAQNSGFQFTISWATNIPVVVEACTNFANPVWQPIQTNTLTGGAAYFSDPQWTNYPGRFYRLRSP